MGSQVDVSAADLGGDFLGVAGRRNELWFRYRFRGMLCGHDESRRSQSRASDESLTIAAHKVPVLRVFFIS
jgi:hypothetical protein